MRRDVDPSFLALPLERLAHAALTRAVELGAWDASIRVLRTRTGRLRLRDGIVEAASDSVETGLGVRLVYEGTWGYAATAELTAEAAARAAEQAVDVAIACRPLRRVPVTLAGEATYPQVNWVSPYEIDPFDVPEAERAGLLADWSHRLLASPDVEHVLALFTAVRENRFYADVAGTTVTQQRVRVHPMVTAFGAAAGGEPASLRTAGPPTGRGWEYLSGTGWDFDGELAELPGQLAAKSRARPVRPGSYDLVIDSSNLWLTIHETVGHATELDRALGHEASYAGTTFVTPDGPGTLRFGAPLMNVTADRTTDHGLATIGVDDEGVASHSGALEDSSLEDLVARAKRAALGECAEPAQSLVTGPAVEDWAQPPAEPDAGVLAGLAAKVGAAIERGGSLRSSLSGYAEQQVSTTYLASSSGMLLRHEQPRAILDLVAARADGSASAWRGVGTACIADLDVASLRAELDQQLGWTSRSAELLPGRYEVLLAPAAVADLMLQLYRAAGAGQAASGQGPFSRPGGGTRLGERLSSAALTLRSDPNEPGLECAPALLARASTDRTSVLDNGLPLLPTRWITDGVLTALVQTRRTAQLTGQHPSAEIANLVLEGGSDAALARLIAGTERALLVTSVWYLRDVDPQRLLVTGLTRDGVYLVEHGEVVAMLPDFRFNESPVELLGRVSEVGRSEPTLPREWGEHGTRVAMPALRVERFDVSAVSR